MAIKPKNKKPEQNQVEIEQTRDAFIDGIRENHLTVENTTPPSRSIFNVLMQKETCAKLNSLMTLLFKHTVRLAFIPDNRTREQYKALEDLSKIFKTMVESSEYQDIVKRQSSCPIVKNFVDAVAFAGKYIYLNAVHLSSKAPDQKQMISLSAEYKQYYVPEINVASAKPS